MNRHPVLHFVGAGAIIGAVAGGLIWRATNPPNFKAAFPDPDAIAANVAAAMPTRRERCVLTDDGRHDGCSGAEARVILSQCGPTITAACKADARAALDALAMREDPPPSAAASGFLPPGKYCVAMTDGVARDCTLEETRRVLGDLHEGGGE